MGDADMKETREQMIARREKSAVIQAKRKERYNKWLYRPENAMRVFNRIRLNARG